MYGVYTYIIIIVDINIEINIWYSLCKFERNCKRLVYTDVEWWLKWLEDADDSSVRDGTGRGHLHQMMG
jgi:hypothetical protein